ncbi:hypothetical protein DSUL_100142 [Desulfovibrionales bacterium]
MSELASRSFISDFIFFEYEGYVPHFSQNDWYRCFCVIIAHGYSVCSG